MARSLLVALVILSSPIVSVDAQAEDDWRFSLSAGGKFGEIDGFVQIPMSGEPGTASYHRPTLDEIGIDQVTVIELGAAAEWRRERIFFDALWIRPSGHAVLEAPLISHGESFPAFSPVESEVQFDQYRLGYGHRFDLGEEWSITPMVAVTLLDFAFQLDSPGVPSARRGFHKLAPMLGAAVRWNPGQGPLDVELRALLTIPYEEYAIIDDVELRINYALLRDRGRRVSVYTGVGFQRIRYDDNYKQRLSNDIEVDLGPLWSFGLEARF